MVTKTFQGDPPLLKVCTDTLTEDDNRDFSRGYPTEISFFNLFGQSGISFTNWREQPELWKVFPHWALFFCFFGRRYWVPTRQSGVWIDFHFSGFFTLFFVREFLPNPISIIGIVEYSMISVLEYFGDTLANVGLPEAWLVCDWDCVNCIENKYVRHESNRIGGKPI